MRYFARAALALLAALAVSACANSATDTLCVAARPIYLTDEAIAALAPHRAAREAIAAHNTSWEARCGD